MKKFKVSFKGRKVGASGIFYKISTVIEMPKNSTFKEINLKLYDNYEHISELRILKFNK